MDSVPKMGMESCEKPMGFVQMRGKLATETPHFDGCTLTPTTFFEPNCF